MPASSPRLAILAVTGAIGTAALCVGALSSAPRAFAEGDHVIGAITSVTGNIFQVSEAGGTVGVEFTDSTKVNEAIQAQRSDVTAGACIKAGAGADSPPASDDMITAKWVVISTAVDGKCPQRPGSSPTPPPAAAEHHGIRGVVKSVVGDTVTVTREDSTGSTSQATVTLTGATHYRKRVTANSQAITQGKCVAARGTRDGSGILQATRVTVWTSSDGECPQPNE